MKIIVGYDDDGTTFDVEGSVTIEQLKLMIERRIGIPADWHDLRFKKKVLDDNSTIADCEIKEIGIFNVEIKEQYNMEMIDELQKPYEKIFVGEKSSHKINELMDNSTQDLIDTFVELNVKGGRKVDTPPQLKTVLKKHQPEAVSFMVWREAKNPSGGILADDMGLGKTLEIISLIVYQKHLRLQRERERTINEDIAKRRAAIEMGLIPSNTTFIVVPKAVVHQWKREIEKHVEANFLNVSILDKNVSESGTEELAGYDVLITNYEKITKNLDALGKIAFERIVLDEAHKIKNKKTNISLSMCKLVSLSRWCVTGTPLHNSIMDVYSLIKFLRVKPFMCENHWNAKILSKNEAENDKNMEQLIRSISLRRTKNQMDPVTNMPLVPLPERTFVRHDLKIIGDEALAYTKLYKALRNEKIKRNSVTYLRQACYHMSLIDKAVLENTMDRKVLSRVTRSDFTSSRLGEIIKIVKDVAQKNEKIVIVSGSVRFLAILQSKLDGENQSYTTITGEVKDTDREQSLAEFDKENGGPTVMLLSLRAGGVGLNLVRACHLILADPDWNPAMEAQACDRIYRVGQEKKVFVHRIVYTGTVEDRVVNVQEEKNKLAQKILSYCCSSFLRDTDEGVNNEEEFVYDDLNYYEEEEEDDYEYGWEEDELNDILEHGNLLN